MIIKLPEVSKIEKVKEGEIITAFLRAIQFESDIAKEKINGKEYYVVKQQGHSMLVAFQNVPSGLKKAYEYILKQGNEKFEQTNSVLDLSNFNWVKHPLLSEAYSKKHDKKYIHASWKDTFTIKTDVDNEIGLRVPQAGALFSMQAHWTTSDEAAIVVMPTGTGKTDTMIASLIYNRFNTLLVVVPTDALRDQLGNKFLSLGILPLSKMTTDESESPIVGLIKHKFDTLSKVESFFNKVNVAIATMAVITACSSDIQDKIAASVTHFFVDEAHHTPAETWQTFKNKFKDNKIVLFTATPFRNDGKRLEGKIIYNFPLKKAQELGYFKPIFFKPVFEYIPRVADQLIAEKAVEQLKSDLENGYDHILMVRVNSVARAEDIYQYYKPHDDFKPVIVHSQIKPKSHVKETIKNIVARQHRIIICVDMLGEGFDLPELKIAAFHDTKKSLTITLQLTGRFTRVMPNLGPATFIANIADPQVNDDLEDLYYRDSDWNILLPDMSIKMSLEQEDFRKFLEGFKGFPNKFPIQSIKHPLSTVIFQCPSETWRPLNYREGLTGIDNFPYVYSDYNKEQEILIVITGKRSLVKWAKIQDFESVEWDIIICYFDQAKKLLYIHASNTNSLYQSFAHEICENSVLLKGESIFRCFFGVNRIRLHNVGVREPLGRAINYIMRVGSDIKTALRDTEIKKAIKSNIFGVGYENGSRTSIGCSHNGRVWSMRTNNIQTWVKWCKYIAVKITNPSIDPDVVLKGTLIPVETTKVPDSVAFGIEWPDIIFREYVGSFNIKIKNEEYPIWLCDIELKSQTSSSIKFKIHLPSGSHEIDLNLFVREKINLYSFVTTSELIIAKDGKGKPLTDFFLEFPPLIYFVDGSFLEGNLYTKVTNLIPEFTVDKFEYHDWAGVDIKKESQTYEKRSDSIQYSLLQRLIHESKYSLLMDDDDKGEIGDIVGFKVFEDQRLLIIDVYHCKFSKEATPGNRIGDFYEVCGQAQRSIKWMEHIDEIFMNLGRRSNDRLTKHGVSRFEVGDINTLDLLKRRARKELKVKMNIFIVQPGLAFSDYDERGEISRLLAVVETYLKETWNADLRVIANE